MAHDRGPCMPLNASLGTSARPMNPATRPRMRAPIIRLPPCGDGTAVLPVSSLRVSEAWAVRRSAGATTAWSPPPGARWGPLGVASGVGRLRVGTDDHGVGHGDDLVDGKVGELRVLANRLGARRLVDADGADRAGALLEDVAADPLDVVGHVVVGDLLRARGGLAELLGRAPAAAAQDHIEVHAVLLSGVMKVCDSWVDLGTRQA